MSDVVPLLLLLCLRCLIMLRSLAALSRARACFAAQICASAQPLECAIGREHARCDCVCVSARFIAPARLMASVMAAACTQRARAGRKRPLCAGVFNGAVAVSSAHTHLHCAAQPIKWLCGTRLHSAVCVCANARIQISPLSPETARSLCSVRVRVIITRHINDKL